MITECQTNFFSIKQYASDFQTFLAITEIEMKVTENEQYLRSLKEANSLEKIDLVWKVDPACETISKFFGSIEMRTQTSSLEFISSKIKQAQIQVVTTKKTSINDVNLILQKEITINGQHIKGCCMSKEGDFLFTSHFFQKSLITIASNDKLKHKMPLGPSYGFDITLIDETTVAITDGNSGQNFGIDIIDFKNQRKIKFIKLPGRTWGITRDHDSLFVCVQGLGIYQVNTSDYCTFHVISCNLPTFSYVSVFLDKIYYTHDKDHCVVCLDKNGSHVWTFQDELILNNPRGIAVDKNGNVYVVEYNSSSVNIISSDGKHHKQILTSDNGLFMPSAIFLDTENRKLLVANTKKTAFVYNIS
ncbi:uncharacterized protein LOC134701318 [Mytilus trossulus]|uniref:uncharacterized protein LOC134701318 n=1 Tax=Mytilus trossulus TaxID=6551 RepID=UPI003007AFFF